MFLTFPFIDRELNPRLRRREKNVLDISFYRSGDCAQNPQLGVSECNGDVSPVTCSFALWLMAITAHRDVTQFY